MLDKSMCVPGVSELKAVSMLRKTEHMTEAMETEVRPDAAGAWR